MKQQLKLESKTLDKQVYESMIKYELGTYTPVTILETAYGMKYGTDVQQAHFENLRDTSKAHAQTLNKIEKLAAGLPYEYLADFNPYAATLFVNPHKARMSKEFKRVKKQAREAENKLLGIGIIPASIKSEIMEKDESGTQVQLTKNITAQQADVLVDMWCVQLPLKYRRYVEKIRIGELNRSKEHVANCGGSWNIMAECLNISIGRGATPMRIRVVIAHELAHAQWDHNRRIVRIYEVAIEYQKSLEDGDKAKNIPKAQAAHNEKLAPFEKWAAFIDEIGALSPYAESYNRRQRKNLPVGHIYYNECHSEVVASMYDDNAKYEGMGHDHHIKGNKKDTCIKWDAKYVRRLAAARAKYEEIWGECEWPAVTNADGDTDSSQND